MRYAANSVGFTRALVYLEQMAALAEAEAIADDLALAA
jgi:hypothetical protein